MRLAGLSVAGEGDVGEGLLVAKVLERRDHVGLEVVPPQAELLLVARRHLASVLVAFTVWNTRECHFRRRSALLLNPGQLGTFKRT